MNQQKAEVVVVGLEVRVVEGIRTEIQRRPAKGQGLIVRTEEDTESITKKEVDLPEEAREKEAEITEIIETIEIMAETTVETMAEIDTKLADTQKNTNRRIYQRR